MKIKKRQKENIITDENANYKNFLAYTIAVFLIIFPFCVYSHVEQLSELAQQYFSNTEGYTADFFLYHKEILLVTFSVWLVLFFIGEHIYPEHPVGDIPLRRESARVTLYLVGIYALFILLSTMFAKDTQTALWGSCTEYEGIPALVGYLVLFLAGYNYFQSEHRRKILRKALIILMTVISILALVEFFYKPIYELGFMKYLIAPAEYRKMACSLSNKEFIGRVTLSFYNPGYLGGLCAMLLPVCFGFAYEEEKKCRKILYFLLNTGLCFTLLGAGSTGAFLAAMVGMVILFFSLRREKKRLLLAVGELAIILSIGFCMTNTISAGKLGEKLFYVATNQSRGVQQKEQFMVSCMELTEGKLRVSTGEREFVVEEGVIEYLVLETLKFTDKNGNEIPTKVDETGILHLQKEGYEAVQFTYNGSYLSMDLGYEDTVDFYVTENGFALVGQNGVALEQIPQSQITSNSLKKLYPVATGRGYMWVNTIPLLKECLFIGKGPGNFVYVFPQNEVVGLLNTHGSYKFVVDKPHNWYLQIAVNTGVISLIAVLGLMFRYFGRGAYEYCIQSRKERGSVFEKTLWAGLMVFCITGLVNDSIVAVNPIFWLLFGVGSCAVDNRRGQRKTGGQET